MDGDIHESRLENVEDLIVEPLKFKEKLAIGEGAFKSLRLKNSVAEIIDTVGTGAAAVGVAKTSAVASTFFAPTGLLAAIGFGTAVTPIGWVIAAGVVASGSWYGVSRFMKGVTSERVTIIPKFINTPMDLLALSLFDLIAPLALKIADVDGQIDEAEKSHIKTYFIKEWGYDPIFVSEGVTLIESNLSEFSIKELAQTLAEFKKANPDCNYESMAKELIKFLTEIMEVDGRINAHEEMAIEKVSSIFKETGQATLGRAFNSIKAGLNSAKDSAGNILTEGLLPKKS